MHISRILLHDPNIESSAVERIRSCWKQQSSSKTIAVFNFYEESNKIASGSNLYFKRSLSARGIAGGCDTVSVHALISMNRKEIPARCAMHAEETGQEGNYICLLRLIRTKHITY